MDFLFRTPLLTFDPRKQKDIEENWELIIEAVTYSSPDLALSIQDKNYRDLTEHQQQKLLKYLLRGRYRATPFGYWAGVGLGKWGKSYSQHGLDTTPITSTKATNTLSQNRKPSYCLPVGFKKDKNYYVFWFFDKEKEGWLTKFIESTKVVDKVYEWYRDHTFLDFERFSTWFESPNPNKITSIWSQLLECGMLIPYSKDLHGLKGKSIDLKVKKPLTLPMEINDRLQTIPNEMGALFEPMPTSYMESFKDWFIAHYDDRLVRMDKLMRHTDFWPASFDQPVNPIKSRLSIPGTFWEIGQVLDLRMLIEKRKIKNIRHLQAIFRIGKNEEIQLENFACNHPYAFMGRFGKDPAIHNFFRQTGSKMADPTLLIADVLLKETEKSQQISSHYNLFDYSIDSTGTIQAENILPLKDLWIGIPEGKTFLLYSESHGKQVVPIIQHPLNPSQISHPITKILWHVAQQEVVRFVPHIHASFQACRYTPRLKWGSDICLQREKWTIKAEDLKNYRSFSHLAKEWHIPDHVTFGNYDRELVLDLKSPIELDIIEKELRSKGRCHISSAEWVGESPVYVGDKTMIYPQVIKSWAFEKPYPLLPHKPNFQFNENTQWVYVKVHLESTCVDPFLHRTLHNLVERVISTGMCKHWFYLFYVTKHQEIRIRFLLKDPNCKSIVKGELFQELEASKLIHSYNFEPYFPEVSKFGGGMEISENIFALESAFILLLLERKVDFRAHALSIVSELYFFLFRDHPESSSIFERLKEIKGRIGYAQKKITRGVSGFQQDESYNLFMDDYITTMKNHPLYNSLGHFPDFLFHHLHLFANRIYLDKAVDGESSILYLTYKKMGRTIAHCVP
ncbi:thiopeptide-type bacteriocin biosynthesis protein [Algoriphagus sp. NG3]|uniref:thiopeptide-type bacteriocin biosynthesis protein n=1 Tax=Algoriphagus sp. NG3 TaxID=3097546 RepID=UPI002A83A15C|nr:thiopeptide-type bacteriocin biosynthesis protein [Algoriphagus sp. NG3]WPR77493.1 thiopeptide-type bacteriocin biosynthesis protein [Algoriphagus sp. NG3]